MYAMSSPTVLMVEATLPQGKASQGSAVAVTRQLLLTNCHVVDKALSIEGFDGRERRPLRLAAADSKTDRCILSSARADLQPVAGTRSAMSVAVGETVYAIGNPRGLRNTLSEGLVSGIRMQSSVLMIQTTAPLAGGSSGGGLFDAEGRLLGITTFGIGDVGSLNFAIAAEEYSTLLRNVR